jgi:hypothetical protein
MPRPKPLVPWNANPYTIRITPNQRAKLQQLGGVVWIREQIEQAQVQAK